MGHTLSLASLVVLHKPPTSAMLPRIRLVVDEKQH